MAYQSCCVFSPYPFRRALTVVTIYLGLQLLLTSLSTSLLTPLSTLDSDLGSSSGSTFSSVTSSGLITEEKQKANLLGAKGLGLESHRPALNGIAHVKSTICIYSEE